MDRDTELAKLRAEIALLTKQRNDLAYNSGEKIARMDRELTHTREDAALVVHALNCAVQLIEALIAYTPEGSTLHPNVAAAKHALDHAMQTITGRRSK